MATRANPLPSVSMSDNPIVQVVQSGLRTPGLTKDGASWFAKAIHPADSTLMVNGVPSLESVPTASLNFMTTQTIAAPANATWSADVILAPTPLTFGKCAATTGAQFSSTTAYNTTLGVGSFNEFGAAGRTWYTNASTAWANNVQSYRLMYACVTATLSASSLANEGVVTCAQYTLPFYEGCVAPAYNLNSPTTRSMTLERGYDYNRRSQSQLQATSGAVTWEAKKGMYSILKLKDLDRWQSSRSGILCTAQNGLPLPATFYVEGSSGFNAPGAAAASAIDVPFGQQATWNYGSVTGSGASTNVVVDGLKMYPPANDNVSQITFIGLDGAASLTLTYRVGFEVMVQPESIYAGQVSSPVEHDPISLELYFKASREMMAGYPADFNIFGGLFSAVSSLLPKVLPALRDVGGSILRAVTGSTSQTTSPVYTSNPPVRTQPAEPPQQVVVYRQPEVRRFRRPPPPRRRKPKQNRRRRN